MTAYTWLFLGGGNLLALLVIIFNAGRLTQRVSALEKAGNLQVPVAELIVKVDNLTEQMKSMAKDFKELRDRQCTFSGHCALAPASKK
jgi:hypothetical protein